MYRGEIVVYRQRPKIEVSKKLSVVEGEENILIEIFKKHSNKNYVAIETYPGIDKKKWIKKIKELFPTYELVETDIIFKNETEISEIINLDVNYDEQFGRICKNSFLDFISVNNINLLRTKEQRKTIYFGVLASFIKSCDIVIYIDISRPEIQKNFNKTVNNWMVSKPQSFEEKMKRAYYFEWPASDDIKKHCLQNCDYYVSDNEIRAKMMTGEDLNVALKEVLKTPFRVVPLFAPGIWGGQWIRENFALDYEEINLAWGFDGVPEESFIVIKTEAQEIEIPAINLVLLYPIEMLGAKVFGRYGSDFPIRFNFLDTVRGGNLSLQVHPTLDYAFNKFGLKYTQNESYYIFHAGENACVYLGLKNDVTKNQLIDALKIAEENKEFDDTKYVNKFLVKQHDHILIPAGVIHSSGADTVVLEISATQNRFTFKLWDWNRLDLDGKARPVAIKHGEKVIDSTMNEDKVKSELINNILVEVNENNYKEESTGLYKTEDIETKRIIFSKTIFQETNESVNVLNLVGGESAIVGSPDGLFKDYKIYYGETFIIPENIKRYILKPSKKSDTCVIVKAYIR